MSEMRVYVDHAATTPLSGAAWAAMKPFIRSEFGNPSSLHGWGRAPREAVSAARATIAGCIEADPDEIFFTSGGTEADNWAVKGTEGRMVVSSYEHHAVLNAVAEEIQSGRSGSYCNPRKDGCLGPEELSRALNGDAGLVSVMMANNEIGTINPVRMLAEIAHFHGALFHTDGVQAVGHIPVSVRELGVDFLSASGHKFNGPKGVGFLFVRKGIGLKPLLNGGQQERGWRPGTENVAAIVGMSAALKDNCDKIARNTSHLVRLTERFKEGLRQICPDVVYNGEGECGQLPGIASASFPGCSAESMVHLLDLKGVAVSSGAACDSKAVRVSHVLRAIKIPAGLAKSTLRFSWGIENTSRDVDYVLSVLRRLLALRQIRNA